MNPVTAVLSRFDSIKTTDDNLCFVICKSANKNTLAYTHTPHDDTVIRPYWLMYEKVKDGIVPTEALTFLENQMAYGISTKLYHSGCYEVTLAGYKKMKFRLDATNEGSKAEFTVNIDKSHFLLRGIYVHQSPSFFSTGVDGVTIVYSNDEGAVETKYLSNNDA